MYLSLQDICTDCGWPLDEDAEGALCDQCEDYFQWKIERSKVRRRETP